METSISIENRNQTYFSILEKLSDGKREVYNIIKELVNASLDDVSELLGKHKNEFSGRVTELKNECLIVEIEKPAKSRRSNNTVTLYRLTTEEERIDLLNFKHLELIHYKRELNNDLLNLDLCELTKELVTKEIKKVSKSIKKLSELI